jgi:hypothetical protein
MGTVCSAKESSSSTYLCLILLFSFFVNFHFSLLIFL